MEDNKLVFYNMGTIEGNKSMFKVAIEHDFDLYREDLEKVVGGYKFLFDSEKGSYIRVEFVDNGCQLKTTITGEFAEDVIAVYKSFGSRFF